MDRMNPSQSHRIAERDRLTLAEATSGARPSVESLLVHEEPLRRLARRLLKDESRVDDALQDTWVVAISNFQGGAAPRSVLPWLRSVLRNGLKSGFLSEQRRERREREVAQSEELPDVSETVERAKQHRALVDAVISLGGNYSEVLLWHYFEDRSVAEIAKHWGTPVSSVHTRLGRARERLAAELQRRGGGGEAWLGGLLLVAAAPGKLGAGAALGSGASTSAVGSSAAGLLAGAGLVVAAVVLLVTWGVGAVVSDNGNRGTGREAMAMTDSTPQVEERVETVAKLESSESKSEEVPEEPRREANAPEPAAKKAEPVLAEKPDKLAAVVAADRQDKIVMLCSPRLEGLVKGWSQELGVAHGGLPIKVSSKWTEKSGLGGLRKAALGLSTHRWGAEAREELKRRYGLGVWEFEIAQARFEVRVHTDNPIESVSLEQLHRVFTRDELSDYVVHWSQLDPSTGQLSGSCDLWDRRIQVLIPDDKSACSLEFGELMLGMGRERELLNFKKLKGFHKLEQLDRALAKSCSAMCFSGVGTLREGRVLAIRPNPELNVGGDTRQPMPAKSEESYVRLQRSLYLYIPSNRRSRINAQSLMGALSLLGVMKSEMKVPSDPFSPTWHRVPDKRLGECFDQLERLVELEDGSGSAE